MTVAEELRRLLEEAPGPDLDAADVIARRARQVLRPVAALARFDEIAAWLGAWQRTVEPVVQRPAALVFASDHGVTAEGVSAYPDTVTAAMVEALEEGVATVSVLAREAGASVRVVDVGVGRPTGNITVADAMSRERFAASIAAGREAVAAADGDLIAVGEMGIGNSTAAAAVAASLYGGPVSAWVGRGSGVDDPTMERKIGAVRRAVARIEGTVEPLEVLRRVGGAELAAIAGAIVEARVRSIPVVLDGYMTTAAAAPIGLTLQGGLAHCIAGHRSSEPGHGRLLERLGMQPILELDLRLGEGSGAVAAIPLIRMAATAATEVPTFSEWGLSPP